MQILMDESCDYSIVKFLQNENLDIISVLEDYQGVEDRKILELAKDENRVLITEDRDFGRRVFLDGEAEVGVILLRYPFQTRNHIKQSIKKLLSQTDQEKITGSFTVVTPGKIRFHKLPSQKNS